jgi:hypothetical protein
MPRPEKRRVPEHGGPRPCDLPGHIEKILDGDGQAFQGRTRQACAAQHVGCAGAGKCLLVVDLCESPASLAMPVINARKRLGRQRFGCGVALVERGLQQFKSGQHG